eukprot:scaffold19274_cov46-Phaeocystis_antarctica.AAC.2
MYTLNTQSRAQQTHCRSRFLRHAHPRRADPAACPAPPIQGTARGSAATDRPSASATSCAAGAAEYCTATERRCVVNAMNVHADHVHVVSSYSDAVSLFTACWRATPVSTPLRSSSPDR